MGNLRDESKLRNMQPTDVVLGADEDGCLVNFPPDNFSGSIPISIDTETGDGEELFTEPNVNDFLFKKLKSKDGSADVITDTDGNIDLSVNFPEIPTVDYPVIESEDIGSGISLRRNLVGKKIGIKTLNPNNSNVIFTENEDGSVSINTPGGGSSSNDYFLDVNFIRPTNWLSKAESIDGIPTAKGTLNDPFKDFDEYLRRTIGETGGSNGFGAYSRVNPKQNKTLQILSSFETNKVLEINNNSLYFKNKSFAVYTGTEEYAYNTERLWDAMPKTGGVLNRAIICVVKGEGGIVNKFHAGAICHKTSTASTTNTIKCFLILTATGSGLSFYEMPDSAIYTPLTLADGVTPYLHGGFQAKGSTQVPTTPIIKIKGNNLTDWGAAFEGTKITIISNIQSHLQVTSLGGLTCNTDSLEYLVNSNLVGYEKKLYPGLVGMTADEIEILGAKSLYFKPHTNKNIFQIDTASYLVITNLSTLIDQRYELGVNAIAKVSDGSSFVIRSAFKELGGSSAISFVESIGTGNYIEINNASQFSANTYFTKGDGINNVNIVYVNSRNNPVDIISKNVPTLNINTAGSWSSIKSIPINTVIASFASNALAVDAGYIVGMAYFNTTENAISRVS